ncbi:hypothetical protein CPB83DRAFT_851613 [Crepidotus variabilis]|uniref:N-acetyltransferase domain-containing protein n=1 Tax=Crepidotus variabilis TaxID=179855 RepID=A0A9P6JRB9_9AGAR|nr:hypothetical protein CPB83DRAFT_851613 [Crepidotus variabilis]
MSTTTPAMPLLDYNHNFCFSVPNALESDRILLTPFIPEIHTLPFVTQAVRFPEIYDGLPFGPFEDADEMNRDFVQGRIQKDPGMVLFAIYDKTRPADADAYPAGAGALAGVIGYLNTKPAQLQTEIGFVMIYPSFQRTHVTSNVVGLLLHYALDVPSADSFSGHNTSPLAFRRVVWQANNSNKASVRCAERLGFKLEAILRWDRVLPPRKKSLGVGNGINPRVGDPHPEGVGRDTALLALCWDDWENGERDKVDIIMQRVV